MTIKVFKTRFSLYEVDEANKLVRRVKSEHGPTPSQAPDGNWQPYSDYNTYADGLIFYWPGSGKATLTSTILDESTREAAPAASND